MADLPLYPRILGHDFGAMPDMLRRFHEQPEGGSGKGTVEVRCGDGALRRMMARLMGLPRPGREVPVLLRVEAANGREIWIRKFGDATLRTEQWESAGMLVERSGPAAFHFKLRCDARGMTFHHHHSTIFGLRLPRVLAPSVNATVLGNGTGWELEVIISLPLLGVITTYQGSIQPDL